MCFCLPDEVLPTALAGDPQVWCGAYLDFDIGIGDDQLDASQAAPGNGGLEAGREYLGPRGAEGPAHPSVRHRDVFSRWLQV